MNIYVSSVGHLFHTEMVNRKFNRNAGDGEEEQSMVLRRDIPMISQKGKTMSTVERLMKQRDFIKECKDTLLEQMKEGGGYSSADINEKIEEYEKQLDSLDEQIAKEMAKGGDEAEKSGENDLYKNNRPVTKQELDNKRMADITKLSSGLKQSEIMDSVKNRMEGEKNVLEAELKSGDSERKRQRIAEIDNRTEELEKENFKKLGELADNTEDDQ